MEYGVELYKLQAFPLLNCNVAVQNKKLKAASIKKA